VPGTDREIERLGIAHGLWRQQPEAFPCRGFQEEVAMYRVYSGPPGIKKLSPEERSRCLYQEFGFIDEALDFAAAVQVTHGALHPRDILLSSDDTRLTGLGIQTTVVHRDLGRE